MAYESAYGRLSALSSESLGTFRGGVALEVGVTRKQLSALVRANAVERVLPDTYRMTAVSRSSEQDLRAALLWAGDEAVAAGHSAGELYGLEGVHATTPEIVVPVSSRIRSSAIIIHRPRHGASSMVRMLRGVRVTGTEATLVLLAHSLDAEALEIACEDARRRRLTTVPALYAYLDRFGRQGRPGVAPMRRLLGELDPQRPSRSTLEVMTRRLLVANGITDFVREFPLDWCGRTYRYDFGFERRRVILETNGRRWHDDPTDYEHDNEKWSVPARCGYRIVFATWNKVTRQPDDLLRELAATMAAR